MLPNFANNESRNLNKNQLGGVIFGCKNNTINECLSKQLFGSPAQHYSYVRNINPGLPLFLFNCSNNKLYGIFEAASSGQMNIDPYGWTTDGSRRTPYPAQVQIRVCLQCHPLAEERFKPVISHNYYSCSHFWFELDHAQTSKLVALFASLVVAPGTSVPDNTLKWRTTNQPIPLPEKRDNEFKALDSEVENILSCKWDCLDDENRHVENPFEMNMAEEDENDLIHKQLQKLDLHHSTNDLPAKKFIEDSVVISDLCLGGKGSFEEQMGPGEKVDESPCTSSCCQSIMFQLVQGMEELKAFKAEQTLKMSYLEEKLAII